MTVLHETEPNRTRVDDLAALLFEAERTRTPIEPLTQRVPDLTVDEAYEIQLTNVRRRAGLGANLRGHKIGLTAKVMQQAFGINEPDYGHLFDEMFEYESWDIPISRYIAPRVEVETAFILQRRIEGPGVTVADVIRAVEWVVPSFEMIDSRIRDWQITHVDTVADNGSSGGVVLGGRPMRLDTLDLRRMTVTLWIDDQAVSSGSTADVLGNPLTAVAWLANALARKGVAMEEGQVVLPGTCIRAVPVSAGMHVRAEIAGLGDIAVRFV